MRLSVKELLDEPERAWSRAEPASEDQLAELVRSTRTEWPEELLDLWRVSNGGSGELALPPAWFNLTPADEVADLNADVEGSIPERYVFFGTNGGVEMLAIDLSSPKRAIVAIDPVARPDSAVVIAEEPYDLILAIGLEFKDA